MLNARRPLFSERVRHNYDVAEQVQGLSQDLESALGASEEWSPAQTEIYSIAREIAEYCLSPEAAVSAATIAKPDLYATHNRWIKERMQEDF